jgi:hypothetical protein
MRDALLIGFLTLAVVMVGASVVAQSLRMIWLFCG